MFRRANIRKKDGKPHRYWNLVESRRMADGRVLQRQVLSLGEINDRQKAAWTRAIEVFADEGEARQMAIFPDDRPAPSLACEVVQTRLSEPSLHRPRQWGACSLALTPVRYLVGTPKGRLSKREKAFLTKPWEQVRESVQVKLLEQGRALCPGAQRRAAQQERAPCGGA
jgi:hypothetical protein